MQRCKAVEGFLRQNRHVENPAILPQMAKKMPQNIPGTPQILLLMSYPIDWYLQVLRDAADEARNAEKRIQLTSIPFLHRDFVRFRTWITVLHSAPCPRCRRNSPQFRDLLAIILEAGNYINGDPGAKQDRFSAVGTTGYEQTM